jgi:hypothetical protein
MCFARRVADEETIPDYKQRPVQKFRQLAAQDDQPIQPVIPLNSARFLETDAGNVNQLQASILRSAASAPANGASSCECAMMSSKSFASASQGSVSLALEDGISRVSRLNLQSLAVKHPARGKIQ